MSLLSHIHALLLAMWPLTGVSANKCFYRIMELLSLEERDLEVV